MEEEIRETLTRLNSLLGDMPYELDIVDPRDLVLLDKNARYMTHEMFQNLVGNVKRDGALSSIPLCYREKDGRQIVLSGNHRVQAAVHASVPRIIILRIKRELSREEQVAVQLSHNAIEGKDDPVILKELWDEIVTIDLKMYAGLDTELLKDLEKMEFVTIGETPPDFKQMILLFLPEELEQIRKIFDDVDALCAGDENYLLSRRRYDEVFKFFVEVKDRFNIVNNPTAFMKILEMARLYMETLPPDEGRKGAS